MKVAGNDLVFRLFDIEDDNFTFDRKEQRI
jgi:hypothetical protein